ncbi:MAG: DUF1801 domain-containing protein [Pseudomonadota bacterium]
MAKATNKTAPNVGSVTEFLKSVDNASRRAEARTVMRLLRKITGKRPVMWGSSIIGYDRYHYRYQSGREGEWPMIGLSPRAQNLTIYIMPGFKPFSALMKRLGKHKTGKSCLYLKRLDDVDEAVLVDLMTAAYAWMREHYPPS